MPRLAALCSLLLSLTLLLCGVSTFAQQGLGRIAGTVADQSGAAIAGAALSIASTSSAWRRETLSVADGTYRIEGIPEGSYTLSVNARGFEPAVRSGIAVIPDREATVNVTLGVGSRQESVTVVGEGYATLDAAGGTKSDLPLLETPMAVQIIPVEVIEDRQERSALEAVRNVSGVAPSTYEFYDQFFIRGFDSGYGATFRNGLQMRGITEAVNMAFVDHIEVVKGPASMLYGRIEPGGFVNVVTAKPHDPPSITIEQQAGSWGAIRSTAVMEGHADYNRTLQFRLAGNFDKAGSWMENSHRNNKTGGATLKWQPNTHFNADLEWEQYGTMTTWLDASIPVIGNRPANVSRHFSILYPESWTAYPYDVNRTLLADQANYSFNSKWRLANRFHFIHSNEDQEGFFADPWGSFDGVSKFTGSNFIHNPNWARATFGTNLDLTGELRTGALRHNILVGFDWADFTDDTPGSVGDIAGAAPVDIHHPVFGHYLDQLRALAATDRTNILWRDRSNDTGIYFQDRIGIGERWSLLAGGRYDAATDGYASTYGTRDSSCYPNCTGLPISSQPTDHAFSPRAGLLFKSSDNSSIYASYSKSFGDSNGRDSNGNPLKPQIGVQCEAGAKATLIQGKVTGSATFYNLTKSNITEYDPVSNFPRLVGQARSRGVELDIAGQLTQRLSTIASYAFDQAIITKDPYYGTQGKRLSGVSPHLANIWTKFDTSLDPAKGWSFGGGLSGSAMREGDDPNTWQLPGYARLDAMIAYRHRLGRARWSLQLNVDNLLDRKYFDHGGFGVAGYGAPRGVVTAMRWRF